MSLLTLGGDTPILTPEGFLQNIGNLESARKAKENRLAMREQLQIERDLQLGYDGLDDVEDGQGPST